MANHPHTPTHADSHTFGPDTRAAFMGLVFGAIILFVIVRGIVYFTNAHYAGEKPAAEATK